MTNYFKYEKIIQCKDTGEICKGYTEYLKSNHWKAKRHELINDDSVCHQCGCKGILQLHHLSYKRLGNESIKDLIPLCDKCHKEEHKNKDAKKEEKKFNNVPKKKKKSKKKFVCKRCGSTNLLIKIKSNQTGLYCSDCGRWIKWLKKKEIPIAKKFIESNKSNSPASKLEKINKDYKQSDVEHVCRKANEGCSFCKDKGHIGIKVNGCWNETDIKAFDEKIIYCPICGKLL